MTSILNLEDICQDLSLAYRMKEVSTYEVVNRRKKDRQLQQRLREGGRWLTEWKAKVIESVIAVENK